MTTHTTPLPDADPTGQEAAEPDRRAARFDQRGIALQTVIIMVVLLAIAGTVAAVLLTRAAETTDQLEQQDTVYDRADTYSECVMLGGSPLRPNGTPANAGNFDSCGPPP